MTLLKKRLNQEITSSSSSSEAYAELAVLARRQRLIAAAAAASLPHRSPNDDAEQFLLPRRPVTWSPSGAAGFSIGVGGAGRGGPSSAGTGTRIITPTELSPHDVMLFAQQQAHHHHHHQATPSTSSWGDQGHQGGAGARCSVIDPASLPPMPFRRTSAPPAPYQDNVNRRRVSAPAPPGRVAASAAAAAAVAAAAPAPLTVRNPLEMLAAAAVDPKEEEKELDPTSPTPDNKPPVLASRVESRPVESRVKSRPQLSPVNSSRVVVVPQAGLAQRARDDGDDPRQDRASQKKGPRESNTIEAKATTVVADPTSSSCYVGERHPTTNLRHGRGMMRYPNGCRYVGQFRDDRRHGFGKVWYPSGRGTYVGRWARNRRHGHGTMTYANGDSYEGMWEDDVPHGEGRLTTVVVKESGEASSSSISDPSFSSPEASSSVEVYEGQFVTRKKHGHGVFRHANGDVYDGEWADDVRHGPGALLRAGGEVERRLYVRGRLMGIVGGDCHA